MRPTTWKFGALIVVILATLGWLAFTGIQAGKSYFVTVKELKDMPAAQAHSERLRVEGNVVPGSIKKGVMETDFSIAQGGKVLPVMYVGTDPLPDTFVDNAQAVALGRLESNGVFRASGVQAKCASKYAPKKMGASGAKMTTSAGM